MLMKILVYLTHVVFGERGDLYEKVHTKKQIIKKEAARTKCSFAKGLELQPCNTYVEKSQQV